VDAMEGRRSLADVLAQIDGLGPNRRRNSSSETSSRRPRRRSDVSLTNEGNNQTQDAPPVRRQGALTPPRAAFEDDGIIHGTRKSSAKEMVGQMDARRRDLHWPLAISRKGSQSRAFALSNLLDDAIALVEEDLCS
jgi:hypothetical protein